MKDNQPNFDQFIEFILVDYVAKNKHGDYIVKNLRGGHLDPHLNFYWRKCDMCNMHYDVIGKAETSKEDLEYIFTMVNIKYEYTSDYPLNIPQKSHVTQF